MFLCIIDLRVGLHKGHPTTAIEKQVKPSHRKGIQSTRTQFVRSVIREVAGFAPYERRVMELLRNSKVRRAALPPRYPSDNTFRTRRRASSRRRVSARSCAPSASLRSSALSSRRAGGLRIKHENILVGFCPFPYYHSPYIHAAPTCAMIVSAMLPSKNHICNLARHDLLVLLDWTDPSPAS